MTCFEKCQGVAGVAFKMFRAGHIFTNRRSLLLSAESACPGEIQPARFICSICSRRMRVRHRHDRISQFSLSFPCSSDISDPRLVAARLHRPPPSPWTGSYFRTASRSPATSDIRQMGSATRAPKWRFEGGNIAAAGAAVSGLRGPISEVLEIAIWRPVCVIWRT